MKEPVLKELNVVIVSHVFATGPSQELEDYLKNKVKTLVFIGHPLSISKESKSFYKIYNKGKLTKQRNGLITIKSPVVLSYFKDFFYTFFGQLN